jgi:ribosomal protein S18 acetylase RimI-like enzyme
MKSNSPQLLLSQVLLLAFYLILVTPTSAFSVSFGLGAVLFQPKGLVTTASGGDPQKLLQASEFFVDAFWVGKVGGGAKQLNGRQKQTLSSTQFMEFRGRYAGVQRGQSELIVCELPAAAGRDGAAGQQQKRIIGCAGIEVTPIPKSNLKGPTSGGVRAPLMSNLAVSREFRRKGIAEKLVEEAERVARYEWGYDDCYLYVEDRNRAAVKLYEKLGYRRVWVDRNAKTLLPSPNGNLLNSPTTIVCMKKRLGRGVFGRLWPF